ncbi:hypothetical protein JTE90_014926 [Oedothorax gibbosus]|uniref:Cation-dependent mannose-6-phosphate receptor n=1 Tax=Oedothorax gibbosus TaxID=931172 RepID=A0AAV6VLC9_9ARAC|nr:hypothetical protein JTE90_014926 [Oedothorax gibbosus]
MFLKILCFFISFVGTAVSLSICVTQTPCRCVKEGGNFIDLSSIASEGIPRFYEVVPENYTDVSLYSYNPCVPFDSPDKFSSLNPGNVACANAAACVRTPGGFDGGLPEEHALGLQATAVFESEDDVGLHIKYTVPGANQKLTVKLVCNESISYHLSIDIPETKLNLNVNMTLTSKCACDNGCPSSIQPASGGLSTGSKLLIAFFTITLAYFIVGIVWNLFNGAQGIEIVPNLDFWNELPKLIVEGVSFACTCCGKRTAYGEV